ncbi:hypothetical protein MKW98_000745, partial [Papaver atlanticum]
MGRVIESEALKNLLKQKNGVGPVTFLQNFIQEINANMGDKITKDEPERKLKDAAKDESDPQHFVILFAMWLCTMFFFTDSGAT